MDRVYINNLETDHIELHFTKEEYNSFTDLQKNDLRSNYVFSGKLKAWVSRGTKNHYRAIECAKRLGFTIEQREGERLSFAEKVELQSQKAEDRAERYDGYAANAQQRGSQLQKELESYRGDIAFFTQPIISGHAGSQAFAKRREAIYNRYNKGFEEYRKSEYFRDKADTAKATAEMGKYTDRAYLGRRIEECNVFIRKIERNIFKAEESQNTKWLERLLDLIEKEIDKLSYLQNCLDECGVAYSKNNIKPGYLVKYRGYDWEEVGKTNEKTFSVVGPWGHLKHLYTEITEVKIPEGWQEKAKTKPVIIVDNPFKLNDVLVKTAYGSDNIIHAYQIIKLSGQFVIVRLIEIVENKPVLNDFIIQEQLRKKVRKTAFYGYHIDIDGSIYKPYKI